GVGARPGLTRHIGVLRAEPEPALGSAVEGVPEAGRTLDNRPRVAGAIGEGSRIESRRATAACARAGSRFGVATVILEGRRSVSDQLPLPAVPQRIEIICPGGVLRSRIGIDVEFLAVIFQRGQTLVPPDQMHRSVGSNRKIGKLSCAVTADSAASEAMEAKDDVLVGEVPAGIGAKASAFFRGVVGSRRGSGASGGAQGRGRSKFDAREDAVGEAVYDTKYLVVPKAGIKGGFGDEIGRRIGRVSPGCVVAIAGARFAEQEIVGVSVRGERALRVFHGESDRHLIAEVFR